MTTKSQGGTPIKYSNQEIQALKEILLNHAKSNILSDISPEKLDTIHTNQELRSSLKGIYTSCPPQNPGTDNVSIDGRVYTMERTARTNLDILAYGIPRENLPIAAALHENDLASSVLLWRLSTNQ